MLKGCAYRLQAVAQAGLVCCVKKEQKAADGFWVKLNYVMPLLNALNTAILILVWKSLNLAQNTRVIWRTAGPILGLFVLIWMHFSLWIQIWTRKFKIWKFLILLRIQDLTSAISISVHRVKSFVCVVVW